MKKIYLVLTVLLTLFISCDDDYSLSTDFTIPTELDSPDYIYIDLESSDQISFSWSGGGAEDGSYVLYEVLFDKEGGDFSNPIYIKNSEYNTDPELRLTTEELGVIARKAGISPLSKGKVIWTVKTSKGGVTLPCDLQQEVLLERGPGIDNVPESLYLLGSATENGGQEGLAFRMSKEGVFVIYTKISKTGSLYMEGKTGDTNSKYYISETLVEDEGDFTIEPSDDVYRITVNFNSLRMTTEKIKGVRAIWGATYETIGNLDYVGNGVFKADNCNIEFVSPDRPHTNPPSWLSWVEERYYFIANVDGTEKCWGRMDGISAERPIGGESLSFYELGEFTWDQWEHLWKMSGNLDMKKATISINTNKDNMMIHEFTNVVPM